MVASVTWPSSSESRVVIGGMTMRLGSSTAPISPGMRRGLVKVLMAAASHPLHLPAVHVDGGAVQPAAARRDHEGDEAADVLGRAEADHADVVAVPFAHRGLVLAGALHVGLDAAPEALGLDVARVDRVDLHAVALAAVGERLGEGGRGR